MLRRLGWLVGVLALQASAFSQRSPVTPTGHEYLTVRAAEDAVKESSDAANLSGKGTWTGSGCEKGCPGHDFGAANYLVWSAVQGQRWVDFSGFAMTTAGHRACWDAITQSPENLQYEHFLRMRTDEGPEGGRRAMSFAVRYFRMYFLSAVSEKGNVPLKFMDGGAVSGVVGGEFTADRAYFLFGRALHLFQDSFSLEHAVRRESDGYTKLWGIKSYVCTKGSPQHGRSPPSAIAPLWGIEVSKPSRSAAQLAAWGTDPNEFAKNGDVLWKTPTGGESADNLKPHVKVAIAAMKDVWLAFERARAGKVRADVAVDDLIARWMTIEGNGGDAVAFDADACKKDGALKSEKTVNALREKCLAITGKNPDDSLRPPYTWTALGANWPDADLLDQAGAVAGEVVDTVKDTTKTAVETVKDTANDVADGTEKAAGDGAKGATKATKKASDAFKKIKKSF